MKTILLTLKEFVQPIRITTLLERYPRFEIPFSGRLLKVKTVGKLWTKFCAKNRQTRGMSVLWCEAGTVSLCRQAGRWLAVKREHQSEVFVCCSCLCGVVLVCMLLMLIEFVCLLLLLLTMCVCHYCGHLYV